MRLTSFSVTNFRSITSAHKVAVSDSTVLIGKNNEGKSNLLRALQVAMELLQTHAFSDRAGIRRPYRPQQDSYHWSRDFPIQLQGRKSSKQTIFKIEFLLNPEEVEEFKAKIGSSLNGSLPLEIKIGKENEAQINLRKPGKNTKALSAKIGRIADFVARRIYFNYIPAVRTDREAIEVVSRMLSQELRVLERDESYQSALKVIQDLQQPILDDLANRIREPLAEFLPSIEGVQIEIPETSRRIGVRRDFNVIINDGTPTNIEYKGDGVKSLAALGLLKNKSRHPGASIVAIEEPESHLHPGAIHQLNEIIKSLAETNQVILTTHNPLFVDRENIKTNIIVNDGKATPAKNVSAIRDILGIKASDNLTNANYALVVEGEEDVKALKAILPYLSEKLGKSLKSNSLVIEPIGGAGNLSYKLSLLKNSLCVTHALLDNDDAGRKAFQKASEDSLLDLPSCTMITCRGMTDSEFEDCLDVKCYEESILNEFGVSLKSASFKSNRKWSDRLKETFMDQGKPWNEGILRRAKNTVASEVSKKPQSSLNEHKRNSVDALVVALEKMIKS
ncbi:ATP-dependent nuclease [Marinobacter lutaoensis]|uniref:ATP-dependent nuclease n=1 Tax=Marinobacter lutaoensis TaxID=135739 RepID=UPI0015945E43|nr:ATP-binding protein [Marinobacter lutaoensis]NVD35840.1 AAA family ATPase [Marinobacter lutaoensis]